jgi:ketosteroid isomerase-like protein
MSVTVTTDPKIQTVVEVYEAFGRGDVPAILDRCTDDVDWATESQLAVAPWHGVHHGKAEVPRFFAGLAEATETTEFTPLSIAANDTDVFVLIRYSIVARSTGRSVTLQLHHVWRFRDGLISYYRGSEDTAVVAGLFQA